MGDNGVRVGSYKGTQTRKIEIMSRFHKKKVECINRFFQCRCPGVSPAYSKMPIKENYRWILPKEQVFSEV